MAFEGEEVFEGVEDRFDLLADGGEPGAGSGFVCAGWADDGRSELFDGVFEVFAGVAFVADDCFAAVDCAGDQLQRDVPFGPVGWGGLDTAGVPSGANRPWRRMPQNRRE